MLFIMLSIHILRNVINIYHDMLTFPNNVYTSYKNVEQDNDTILNT
jgi:hypothetical protein